MTRIRATVFGFLAASALPAFFLAAAAPLSASRELPSILGSFIVFYYFTAVSTAILGVPAFLVLNKLKLIRWWSAVGCGTCVGAIAHVAVIGGVEFAPLLRFASLGGVAGLVFWMFWRTGDSENRAESESGV